MVAAPRRCWRGGEGRVRVYVGLLALAFGTAVDAGALRALRKNPMADWGLPPAPSSEQIAAIHEAIDSLASTFSAAPKLEALPDGVPLYREASLRNYVAERGYDLNLHNQRGGVGALLSYPSPPPPHPASDPRWDEFRKLPRGFVDQGYREWQGHAGSSFDAMQERQALPEKHKAKQEEWRKEERLAATRATRQARVAELARKHQEEGLSPLLRDVHYASQRRHDVQALLRETVATQGYADIVMLGDEFIEALLGNRFGVTVNEANAHRTLDMVTKLQHRSYPSTVRIQGIPGDTTEMLLDRVEDMGEISAPPPKIVTLEIGTHDLPHLLLYTSLYPDSKEVHERTEQQLQRIADNVEILVYHMNDWGPAVHTLVMSVLPRADDLCEQYRKDVHTRDHQQCPHEAMLWPHSKYFTSIQRLNELLREMTEEHDRVTFVDCTSSFVERGREGHLLRPDVFRDGFNVSDTAAGHQAWLDCLYPPLLHTLRRLDPHSVEAWVTPRYVKISLWAAVLFLWTYFAFGHTELYQRCRAAGVEVVAAHTHLAAVECWTQLVARAVAFRRVLEKGEKGEEDCRSPKPNHPSPSQPSVA